MPKQIALKKIFSFKRMVLAVAFCLFFSLLSAAVFAQPNVSINITVGTPPPILTINAVGEDGMEVHWNWDNVSPGYIPLAVTAVWVEISTDGVNYTGLQVHAPADFLAVYTGLLPASYMARVTVIDGNDYDYVIGALDIGGGGGGGGGETEPPPEAGYGDVTVSGLAYPDPATVIFNFNGANVANINTDADGNFIYQTTDIPAGTGIMSFSASDPDGVLSGGISFSYTVPEETPVQIENISLPPTISISKELVTKPEDVSFFGYAYRNGSVSIVFDGPSSLVVLVQVGSSGRWSVNLNTSSLKAGTYDVSAESANSNGTIISPPSEIITFELVSFGAAAVCGNGVLEEGEMCDDGNVVDRDDCSSLCQLESMLPESQISQPAIVVYKTGAITLTYSSFSPNGAVDFVNLYLSRNDGPFELFGVTFRGGLINLSNLIDGDYEAYTVATDVLGMIELAPLQPDAYFTIDQSTQLSVMAHPEKRVDNNWFLPAQLMIYKPGQSSPDKLVAVQADTLGRADIEASDIPLVSGDYIFALKGISHLSKILPQLNFSGVDLILDYTLGGTYYLMAGDVHSSKDDYVNGLDFSAMVAALYGALIDADLNYDGLVNGMDLSIGVGNLYKQGEGV